MDGTRPVERLRLRLRGRVQGVGFRPFVWTLARRHALAGWVRNDAEGVEAEVEGAALGGFVTALRAEAPPLARIDAIETEPLAPTGEAGFRIARSGAAGAGVAAIPPDTAVCDACLGELFDPRDRRHGHAFVTCTQCGPRFTLARGLPYDRAQTSMGAFAMCPACAVEYADPGSRRFHAEPVACPGCGPALSMAPAEIVARLARGEVLAIKGLGGFHLACDARDPEAVARLRARKRRAAKPFAVMVLNPASARELAEVPAAEAALLESPARPVVLCRGRGRLPRAVSGGLAGLGLMLPYTPLHYLLFHEAAGRPEGTAWLGAPHPLALVMTSANPAGEPLVTDGAEAAARLGGIVDAVADHDRAIVARCDDSVAKVVAGAPLLLRRSRGWVPDPVPLAADGPPVMALGALLKVAPCLVRGREAIPGQHVGDMQSAATARFLREAAAHLERIARAAPEAVACDAHPDYPTSRIARESGRRVIPVHHHHAHLAAVAAEHGIEGPLTGLVLDGFGLGPDGTLWGGELLRMAGTRCDRLGALAPLMLPGGDRAARLPWRMAAAVLHAIGRGREIVHRFPGPEGAGVARMLAAGLNCPETSSAGRLFDAAAALLGVRQENRFEGEAAMALEELCTAPRGLPGGWRIAGDRLDLSPLLDRLADTADPAEGADLFHGTLAEGLAAFARARLPREERRIALAGGCAANRPLVESLAARLREAGLDLLVPRAMPPGDGGLALGQALVARRTLKEAA